MKNIWYNTAVSPFIFDSQIYDMAAVAGVIEKVLFGTDFPLLPPDRYYKDLDNSRITSRQKELVLGENAGLLFG